MNQYQGINSMYKRPCINKIQRSSIKPEPDNIYVEDEKNKKSVF